MNFDELKQQCLACQRCGLCETRTHVVFGQGVPDAEVLFVGEGPGANEDAQGLPFVGRSGQLLDHYLEAIDLDRSKNIYIGLVVFTGEYYRYVGLTNNSETLSKALKSNIEISQYYTNIVGALDKSYESFANNDKPEDANRYIFLLSDGLPTSDGDSSHALYAANSNDSALIAQNKRSI